MKTNLLNFTLDELTALLVERGEQKFRAKQLYKWLQTGADFDEMSDLSKKLREKLAEEFDAGTPVITKQLKSSDGTVKLALECRDGQIIETVVMRYKHGTSVCVSTQAGCRMGCKFCASTLGGLKRCLEPGEILGQVIAAGKAAGERIDGIVLMGIGEPMDNYDNVIKFLRLVSSPDGLNIGLRHISLSTCGIVPGIKRLAEEGMPITLSVSLHAPDDRTRSEIMPINNKYPVAELLEACRYYFDKTGRRVSFEYTVIAGVNDSVQAANKLAETLRDAMGEVPMHVNLIPVNHVPERGFVSDREAVLRFAGILNRKGINATIRRHLGGDIDASCGMLRRQQQ